MHVKDTKNKNKREEETNKNKREARWWTTKAKAQYSSSLPVEDHSYNTTQYKPRFSREPSMSFFFSFSFFLFSFSFLNFSFLWGESLAVEDKKHISDKIMLSRLLARVNGGDMSSVCGRMHVKNTVKDICCECQSQWVRKKKKQARWEIEEEREAKIIEQSIAI